MTGGELLMLLVFLWIVFSGEDQDKSSGGSYGCPVPEEDPRES